MSPPSASALGAIYALSEVALSVRKRADRNTSRAADAGSLALLWVVIGLSVLLAFSLARTLPQARMPHAAILQGIGTVAFGAGLALRWYAILQLGRFFTVNVAIADDHRLIDTGLYQHIRHPSYSGALLAFFGLALCLANWASMVVMLLPTVTVFLRRISIEERALLLAFKDQYRQYMDRTQRLIPGIY